MHWLGWGGGWFMIAIWWALIIVGIFFLVKWVNTQRSQSTKADSALEILKKRYARGEITQEEFEQIKKDINDLEG
ncbi:SHOCT domain-containing protein [candidate division KSB1 bacterium]|nr:SHOCT domain-containing protein [candidate division KSB1 bacterium]